MATLHHQIKINAPVEKIWDILTDLEQVGNYNPLVSSVKYISSNKEGVGASRECSFKPKGAAKERVTAIEELKSVSMEMYESDWPLKYMRWTNSLSSDNGQTVMDTKTEFKMKFGIIGSIMEALVMKAKFNKVLDELFVNLKEYAEKKL